MSNEAVERAAGKRAAGRTHGRRPRSGERRPKHASGGDPRAPSAAPSHTIDAPATSLAKLSLSVAAAEFVPTSSAEEVLASTHRAGSSAQQPPSSRPKSQQQRRRAPDQGKTSTPRAGKASTPLQNPSQPTTTTLASTAAAVRPVQPKHAAKARPAKEEFPTAPPLRTNGDVIVLHVAEKPSIAAAIATALRGSGEKHAPQGGGMCPVHEFVSLPFPGDGREVRCTHRVTSVVGHVFSTDFPDQFRNWDATDPVDLFGASIVRKPTKQGVVKHLEREAKGCDVLVLWLDCDREGENICYEVIEVVLGVMRGAQESIMGRVYRAKFSAIGESDILKAYRSLGRPNRSESEAVDARQELDLKVGVAFSRFQTRYFQGRYADLQSELLSYGPCQTPTLGFCVKRHVDIETFVQRPFWALSLALAYEGRSSRFSWAGGRMMERGKAELRLSQCTQPGSYIRVLEVVAKDKKQGRPTPLNTVALLKACSKSLGVGPGTAMRVAEQLYLTGCISYPRTESTAYPASFDLVDALRTQQQDPRWGVDAQRLLRAGLEKPRGGVDHGDHPPITPCRAAYPYEHTGDAARIFELVVRHFLATVSPDAVWRSVRIKLLVEPAGETFCAAAKTLSFGGFLDVLVDRNDRYFEEDEAGEYSYGAEGADVEVEEEEGKALPELKPGQVVGIQNVEHVPPDALQARATLSIKEGMTTPPEHLTESELISLMERNGIGTDASIPTHIENILKRNYVTLAPLRRLKPSNLGIVLAQGYMHIDPTLVLPDVRADIERQCSRIAEGEAERTAVVASALGVFEAKFRYFMHNIEKMDTLFASSFAKLEDAGRPFTRCGLSRRFLSYIEGPPPRLYNKYTETIYPLPMGGVVKQWSGQVCRVEGCGFELLLYATGSPPRTFPLCPYCYNHPRADWSAEAVEPARGDGDEERGEQGIDSARRRVLDSPLPDGHPCIDELAVAEDDESGGVFILDPSSCGQNWRFVSTRAPTIVKLPTNVHKVAVLKKRDEGGCHYVQVDFKQSDSPLPDGKTKHVGMIMADELLKGMCHVVHGKERLQSNGARGRGRGKGRGRWRGRGPKGAIRPVFDLY